MTLTTQTTLALFALAAGLGWYVGGPVGVGIVAGFLGGASIAGLSLALQRYVARAKPQFLLQAVLGGFLLKAFVMLAATLIVHYVPALSDVCSSVSFLVAFAVAVIAILLPATVDTLRLVAIRTARSTPVATPERSL
jgi:hypothetical protein